MQEEKEISIMKYVGATNSFIRAPFMIEGVIIGIMSSAISLGIVGALYNWGTIKWHNQKQYKKLVLICYNLKTYSQVY